MRAVLAQIFARSVPERELGLGDTTGLKRTLGRWQLTALGIGAIIGAGIFASTGSAIVGDSARPGGGPATIIAFALTAAVCGLAALCYAELAAMAPVAGSAYTYAYASFGEVVAWIIGWDLIIEYAVGNIAVAISWAGHFRELIRHFGVDMPAWLATDYRSAFDAAASVANGATDSYTTYLASAVTNAPQLFGLPLIMNLPAAGIVALITILLVRGISESATWNTVMVVVKVAVVLFFVAVGAFFVESSNFTEHGGFMPNGWGGVGAAAAVIFFAYIGFDAVSTASEEAKNPGKDMPFAIIASLILCTVIYILVAVVMTGMAPWTKLGTAEPMLTALELAGGPPGLLSAARFIVALGAVAAMASVLLVFQLGQPRIFYAMARDGLLPPFAARIHPRYRTPHVTTILTGVFVALFAAFANIHEVIDLTNIGTLFAFALVSAGVLALRLRDPDRPRPFRVPAVKVLAPLSVIACVFLMAQLPWVTWRRFIVWLAAGMLLYVLYGYRHSRQRRPVA